MDKDLMYIELLKIKPDPNQPRKIFDAQYIESLAESIRIEGLINPIELDPTYMILTGESRFKAAMLNNSKKVPVFINSTPFTPYTRFRHQLIENLHQNGSRSGSMNAMDTARALAKLIELKTGKPYVRGETKAHLKEIAQDLGVPIDSIKGFLILLEESPPVQADIETGRPWTYYRVGNSLPLATREQLQQKIIAGAYNSRDELRKDAMMLKSFPERGEMLMSIEKQNRNTSSLLTSIARTALALDRSPLNKIDSKEQGVIRSQAEWLKKILDEYLENS